MTATIKTFEMSDVHEVKKFTDDQVGRDYFSIQELTLMQKRSVKNGENSSFVLIDNYQVKGLRLTFPHGNWMSGKGDRLSDHLWDYPIEKTAYFQSLYIHQDYQKQGWGKKLSVKAIDTLIAVGSKGVVCHSWMESPNGSSGKYLESLGFKSIAIYKNYWKNVDYTCPRCGKPCLCTAEEMYLNLENRP